MSTQDKQKQTEEALRLHEEGMTIREISSAMGISPSTVHRRLKGAERRTEPVRGRRGERDISASDLVAVVQGSTLSKADGSPFSMPGAMAQVGEDQYGWKDFGLDRKSWEEYTDRLQLSKMIAMSPGMDRVQWDYARLMDPGHEIEVTRPGEEVEYEEAAAALNLFIEEAIEPVHGSLTGMIQKVHIGILNRGAATSQLLVDDNYYPAGMIIPDPAIIKFKATEDELYGMRWEPGITVKGKWQSVESPLFIWMPFDSDGNNPYGKSVLGSSTFASFFIVAMLWDIRRVTSQQGYSRHDIEVSDALIEKALAPNTKAADRARAVSKIINEISAMVGAMQPDDTFVHTEGITVNQSKGAIDSTVVGGISELMKILERMEIRGLKTMPLMMGISDGVSEANANRQWEIFVQGVKHLQHLSEKMLERQFKSVLQLLGYQADVKFRFAEARSAELLRDEQTATIRMSNAAFAEDRKWMTAEEAGEYAVGHAPPEGEELEEDEPTDTVDDSDDPDLLDEPVDDGGPEDDGGGEDRIRVPALSRFFDRRMIRKTNVGRTDVDHAVAFWKRIWADNPVGDMLNAIPVDTPEQADTEGWSWVRQNRTFVYKADQVYETRDCRELLGTARQSVERRLKRIVAGTSLEEASRELTAGEEAEVEDRADEAWGLLLLWFLIGSVIGRGGTGGMDNIGADDYDVIEAELEVQFGYWQDMESDALGTDDMEDAEGFLGWRAPLYIAAGYTLYETFRKRSWNLEGELPIPLHPNCDCYAEYGEDDSGPFATWVMDGDMCGDCAQMAADYQLWRGR